MEANKTSIRLTENAMDNLIWLENTIQDDPLIMSEREVSSRNRLINLLLETFIPLVRKNFDNHRDWQKTIELLNDISEEKSYANVIKDAKNLKNLDRLLEKTEHNAEVLESLLKVILQVQVKK
ncbi:hypothetical protein HCY80_08580 [Limosilactobacillus fermentum]|uniref:hypothetical protein n=1 Tax=Limosilactobacillus fermentum TaxID=1613 RepID=UPI0030EC2D65